MGTRQQEQTARAVEGHADGHMLFRILPKLRYDQTGGVFLAGAAAGHEEKRITAAACKELRCAGKALAVGARFAEPDQLFHRVTAEPFPDRLMIARFVPLLHQTAKFARVQHTAKLQPIGNVDIDLDVAGHTLAFGFALVIAAEGEVGLADLKGVGETFHKTVLRVDARDLISVLRLILK